MNKVNSLLSIFRNSKIFVSLCACLLGAESYLIAGMKPDFNLLLFLFFATLFIYNTSLLKLNFSYADEGKSRLNISGLKKHIYLALVAATFAILLITSLEFQQTIIFLITALLSLFYMMPFKSNEITLTGLRNNLYLKNIILSFTWSAATVLLPLFSDVSLFWDDEIILMFLRRFFFICGLSVLFDIRDMKADVKAGMQTFPVNFGILKTKILSIICIGIFMLLTLSDPFLQTKEMLPVNFALLLSGFITIPVTMLTGNKSTMNFYDYIIDGSMALQFFLVLLFSTYKL